MAVMACRSDMRGRPAFFFGLGVGSSGTSRFHKASGSRYDGFSP
jgi:hypothetical protein